MHGIILGCVISRMIQQDVLLSNVPPNRGKRHGVQDGHFRIVASRFTGWEPPDGTEVLRSRDAPFVVVGIGASAGGLEALSDLLANLPEKTGMAVVVVQHLDPQHESRLSNLLSRVTHLPVLEATQDLAVRPGDDLVTPRNMTMTIAQGVLQLAYRGGVRGTHLPIDLFLKSLAEDRQSAAIGVILSGTGSDGTLGMEEIKAAGGITFAQDEASAKYSGMPQSAARSGCVDLVLPPDQIARELARIGQHSFSWPPTRPPRQGPGRARGRRPLQEDPGNLAGRVPRRTSAHYRETTVRRRSPAPHGAPNQGHPGGIH